MSGEPWSPINEEGQQRLAEREEQRAEQWRKDATENDSRPRYKKVICPCCGEQFAVNVGITIEVLEPVDNTSEGISGLTDEQRAFLQRNPSLLPAFERAVRESLTTPPQNMAKFLFTFFRTARRRIIPSVVLNALLGKLGHRGLLEFWAAQGIGCVVTDGRIRMFLPLQLAAGEGLRSLTTTKIKGRMAVNEEAVRGWLEGRRGFVEAECKVSVEDLRREALGVAHDGE